MKKEFKKDSYGRVFFLIAALAGILILAVMAFLTQFNRNSAPSVSNVKIVLKENKIVLSYKRIDPDGPEKKDSITWIFDNVKRKELDGLRLVPVPWVFDKTVEIECGVEAYDGINRCVRVKSNKIKFFNASYKMPAGEATQEITAGGPAILNEQTGLPAASDNNYPASSVGVALSDPGESRIAKTPENSTEASPAGAATSSETEILSRSDNFRAVNKEIPSVPASSEKTVKILSDSLNRDKNKIESALPAETEKRPVFKSNSTKPEKAPFEPLPSMTQLNESGWPTPAVNTAPVGLYPRPDPCAANTLPVVAEKVVNRTRLHIAAENNDAEKARQLLKSGVDVNARDADDATPLHLAVANNSVEMITLLINNGASINVKDKKGRTPLHTAASKKSFTAAVMLLEREKEIGTKETDPLLVKKSRLVNLTDKRDQTPLHAAAINDACDIVSLLIKNGADVNASDLTKSTPLHYALLNKSKRTVPVLIANGADVNAKDEFNQTPEHFANEETRPFLMRRETGENSVLKK